METAGVMEARPSAEGYRAAEASIPGAIAGNRPAEAQIPGAAAGNRSAEARGPKAAGAWPGAFAAPFLQAGRTHRLLISLLLAAVIPVLLFGTWVAYVTADRERAESRRAAAATVVQVAERVASELAKELDVAEALAGSADLDGPDLPTFYLEAQRITAARPLWETVSLVQPDGTQVLNILRPLGDPLGPISDAESFRRALGDKRPTIGGIGPVGRLSGKRLVSLQVPVIRDGVLRYILTIGLVPSGISAVLRDAGAPEGWVGTIVDAKGSIVARTAAESAEIGRSASAATRAAIARAPEGFYTGHTPEGVEAETVYRKLGTVADWSVHFGIPAASLNRPVLRSLIGLVAGGVASLALAGGLALLIARDVAQRRREEDLRAALALSVSEDRGAVAVEAADLGTWHWDADRHEVRGSDRVRALLGLEPGQPGLPEATWPTARILAAVHPEDWTPLRAALKRCLLEDAPLDAEFRVVRSDRSVRWVRATGRLPRSGAPPARTLHGVLADIQPRKQAEAAHRDLLKSLADAQEDEQRRIARELHDQVGQTVTGLALGLKSLEKTLEAGAAGEAAREQLRWLQNLANEIGRDIHRAAADLRPTAIDDLGLQKALDAAALDWSRLYGISVDLQALGRVRRLPAETETAVYRVVQEALTNVAKHAGARTVSVVLDYGPRHLRVVVEDDGRGFDPEARPEGDGRPRLGLTGMRERLSLIGGSMKIESSLDAGTTLFIRVPIQETGETA
ncbi:MAG TPA: ATP-binding protein [Microvirga sp.]|jgi:signal transduction histidine kinase|nr:ATP-binding protein [Microvirga sp.]